jgi:hypothetical protein
MRRLPSAVPRNRLIGLRDRCHAVFIEGNHDELMLHARGDAEVRDVWRRYGGDRTLAAGFVSWSALDVAVLVSRKRQV